MLAAPAPKIRAAALLVFVGYYLGAKLGFALTFQPHPVSVLRPPNAIQLARCTESWALPQGRICMPAQAGLRPPSSRNGLSGVYSRTHRLRVF